MNFTTEQFGAPFVNVLPDRITSLDRALNGKRPAASS
jgi:hypothetical protein